VSLRGVISPKMARYRPAQGTRNGRKGLAKNIGVNYLCA
jgi:hypothetical protein